MTKNNKVNRLLDDSRQKGVDEVRRHSHVGMID